jgi:hypothetical protein
MTQENKEQLLKDLCARLPYGVIVIVNGNNERVDEINPFEGIITCGFQSFDVEECKPYLRPMSSMTEEEKEEYHKLCDNYYGIYFDSVESIDWLNKKMLDYRKDDEDEGKTMIEKGLALKVPAGMYK